MWVAGSVRRYMPMVEEAVLGTVAERRGEEFVVEIGGPSKAVLPALAFEGATRRNRPNPVMPNPAVAPLLPNAWFGSRCSPIPG